MMDIQPLRAATEHRSYATDALRVVADVSHDIRGALGRAVDLDSRLEASLVDHQAMEQCLVCVRASEREPQALTPASASVWSGSELLGLDRGSCSCVSVIDAWFVDLSPAMPSPIECCA